MDRYGERRAADLAYANAEPLAKKLPASEKIPVGEATEVHTDEKEEARLEDMETIKVLREKVAALRLEQADNDAQIVRLSDQIQSTTEEALPALTGERVKQLKEYQEKKRTIDSSVAEYGKKLSGAEARYRTAFPGFPLEG